ncbi:hypothetical protein PCE1_001373 [Barthelona sp. PCE]
MLTSDSLKQPGNGDPNMVESASSSSDTVTNATSVSTVGTGAEVAHGAESTTTPSNIQTNQLSTKTATVPSFDKSISYRTVNKRYASKAAKPNRNRANYEISRNAPAMRTFESKVQNFISLVMRTGQHTAFVRTMARFSKGDLSVEQVVLAVSKLFDNDATLLAGFYEFLPPKDQQKARSMLFKMNSHMKHTNTNFDRLPIIEIKQDEIISFTGFSVIYDDAVKALNNLQITDAHNYERFSSVLMESMDRSPLNLVELDNRVFKTFSNNIHILTLFVSFLPAPFRLQSSCLSRLKDLTASAPQSYHCVPLLQKKITSLVKHKLKTERKRSSTRRDEMMKRKAKRDSKPKKKKDKKRIIEGSTPLHLFIKTVQTTLTNRAYTIFVKLLAFFNYGALSMDAVMTLSIDILGPDLIVQFYNSLTVHWQEQVTNPVVLEILQPSTVQKPQQDELNYIENTSYRHTYDGEMNSISFSHKSEMQKEVLNLNYISEPRINESFVYEGFPLPSINEYHEYGEILQKFDSELDRIRNVNSVLLEEKKKMTDETKYPTCLLDTHFTILSEIYSVKPIDLYKRLCLNFPEVLDEYIGMTSSIISDKQQKRIKFHQEQEHIFRKKKKEILRRDLHFLIDYYHLNAPILIREPSMPIEVSFSNQAQMKIIIDALLTNPTVYRIFNGVPGMIFANESILVFFRMFLQIDMCITSIRKSFVFDWNVDLNDERITNKVEELIATSLSNVTRFIKSNPDWKKEHLIIFGNEYHESCDDECYYMDWLLREILRRVDSMINCRKCILLLNTNSMAAARITRSVLPLDHLHRIVKTGDAYQVAIYTQRRRTIDPSTVHLGSEFNDAFLYFLRFSEDRGMYANETQRLVNNRGLVPKQRNTKMKFVAGDVDYSSVFNRYNDVSVMLKRTMSRPSFSFIRNQIRWHLKQRIEPMMLTAEPRYDDDTYIPTDIMHSVGRDALPASEEINAYVKTPNEFMEKFINSKESTNYDINESDITLDYRFFVKQQHPLTMEAIFQQYTSAFGNLISTETGLENATDEEETMS